MSVFKTAKSAPYFWYDFQLSGHRFHGSTRCTSRKEALKFEQAEKDRAKKEADALAKIKVSLALGDVAARYWLHTGQHHAGADTTKRDMNRLCEYFGKDKLLTGITDKEVTDLVAWRRGQHVVSHRKEKKVSGEITGKGSRKLATTKCRDITTPKLVAPATVNRSTTEVLKKLFNFCKGEGVRFYDEPRWKVHKLPEPEPEDVGRELHGDEAKAIDAAMRDDYAPVFEFVRVTGWRQGAAATLRWSECNFDPEVMKIEKQGKGKRKVTAMLSPSILAIIEPLRGHHPEFVFTYICKATKKDAASNAIMIRGQRYPITAAGLKTRWRRTRDDAGVTNFRFHDFRHDFATKLLRQTGNLKTVQKALGHKNIKTTTRYDAVLDSEVGDAVEALAQSRRATSGSGGTAVLSDADDVKNVA